MLLLADESSGVTVRMKLFNLPAAGPHEELEGEGDNGTKSY